MKYFLLGLFVLVNGGLMAQTTADSFSPKPGNSRYMIRGYADATFRSGEGETTFGNARLIPLFVYKQSDRLLFEGELEFEIEDGEVHVALEYASVFYEIGKNMTLRAGKILVPFGTFFDRLHPSWINKLPTVPLGYGHDGLLPTSDLGIEIRSGIYLGNMRANYSLYFTNGARIKDGSEEPEEVGMISPIADLDNNVSKAIGGRFGLFPFSDQSLELGFSAQSGKLGDQDTDLEDVGSLLYAFDFTYVKNIAALAGKVDFRGQLNFINIDNRPYTVLEDGNLETYNFDNKSNTSFYQLAYRPSFGSNFVKNLEVVGRYSTLNTPEDAPWESEATQWAYGLNYWVDWRTAVKFAFQTDEVAGGHDSPGLVKTNIFFIQWTVGF
jgi:hypothetical protein